MRERPALMLGSCQRGCTLSCGQAPGRLLKRRQGALDHVVGGGQADAEVLRRLQHAARHDEDVAVGQGIEQRVAVAAGGAAEEIEGAFGLDHLVRSEEHTSELQSLMRISYAVFCLKKKKKRKQNRHMQVNI